MCLGPPPNDRCPESTDSQNYYIIRPINIQLYRVTSFRSPLWLWGGHFHFQVGEGMGLPFQLSLKAPCWRESFGGWAAVLLFERRQKKDKTAPAGSALVKADDQVFWYLLFWGAHCQVLIMRVGRMGDPVLFPVAGWRYSEFSLTLWS